MLNFRDCCAEVLNNCKDEYAKAYARAGLDMTDPREIKVQSLYIIGNIIHWRGETAKEVRAALKVHAKG